MKATKPVPHHSALAVGLMGALLSLSARPLLQAANHANPAPAIEATGAESSATDERLRRRVVVHATDERIADILAWLSKATGVTLLARMEVADERVSLWAEGRSLIEVMRDLRHLRGYFWSRERRDGKYVYALWQDAQSRAREEAEIQRLAMEQQREFEQNIRKRVEALAASDEELKRLARDDPYLIVQMKHPVVRNGYQLFASLSPDQQAQLVQVRTPSRGLSYGSVLQVFPLEYKPKDPYFNSREWTADMQPLGDIVTLSWAEMSTAQQAVVRSILQGAAARVRDEAARERQRNPNGPNLAAHFEWQAQAAAAADLQSGTATFFRWGDPTSQGLSLRVDFQSGGREWGIYSNIGLPESRFYNPMLREGESIPGLAPEAERLLADMRKQGLWRSPAPPPPAFDAQPDPLLDTPISFTWTLPLRERVRQNHYNLTGYEVLAALHQVIRRPLVLDSLPRWLEQPRSDGPLFRWEKRPVRELLNHLFPGTKGHIHGGALVLRNPNRLQQRLHEVPHTVERYLDAMKGSFTLDDMGLLARSLSPWQIVKLGQYLPDRAIDQTLAAQELLKLYSELSPEQRATLPRGLSFAALTPPQQALFLQFAQRQRPYVEPWRFQHGSLQVAVGPSPIKDDGRGGPAATVSRAVFQFRSGEGEVQAFPVDLFPVSRRAKRMITASKLVGKRFPGFEPNNRLRSSPEADPLWEPALNNPRLQSRTAVLLVTRPFAEPYVGTLPPPSTVAWARTLAERLRGAGIAVAHLTVGPKETTAEPPGAARLPNLYQLWEPGDINGEPFDSAGRGDHVPQSPTIFVVDSAGIVRAVFEGQQAWDAAAVERAAWQLIPVRGQRRAGASPPGTHSTGRAR